MEVMSARLAAIKKLAPYVCEDNDECVISLKDFTFEDTFTVEFELPIKKLPSAEMIYKKYNLTEQHLLVLKYDIRTASEWICFKGTLVELMDDAVKMSDYVKFAIKHDNAVEDVFEDDLLFDLVKDQTQ